MKILKPGKLETEKIECFMCSCIFEFDISDVKYYQDYAFVVCPCCNMQQLEPVNGWFTNNNEK